MNNIAAFFDIDGTLYRDSLMIEHFKKLIKYEVIDPALWHSHVKHTYKEWQQRVGEYEDYMEELAEIYVESLKGLKKEEILFISQQVINLKGDQVYTYTRDQIEWHKSQGHKVFFISGSPEHLVARMAHKYGVEDYKGTEYLLNPDGTFTGEVIPNWDADSKNRVIDAFVEQYGINLGDSYAYGDTNGDLSMMRLVGNPVAINPTRELLDNIRGDNRLSEKTTIIVERKDIIYKLNSDVNTVRSF